MSLWAIGLIVVIPTIGLAQEENDYARSGAYVRGGMAVGFDSSDSLDAASAALPAALTAIAPVGTTFTAADIKVETLLGVAIGGGYRINSRLAVEGAFEWASGDVELTLTSSIFGQSTQTIDKIGSLDALATTADLKGFLLTGRVQPYALVGIGWESQTLKLSGSGLSASQTINGFIPRFGGGADAYLTRNIFLNADFSYLLGTGDLEGENVMLLRVGAGFRF